MGGVYVLCCWGVTRIRISGRLVSLISQNIIAIQNVDVTIYLGAGLIQTESRHEKFIRRTCRELYQSFFISFFDQCHTLDFIRKGLESAK